MSVVPLHSDELSAAEQSYGVVDAAIVRATAHELRDAPLRTLHTEMFGPALAAHVASYYQWLLAPPWPSHTGIGAGLTGCTWPLYVAGDPFRASGQIAIAPDRVRIGATTYDVGWLADAYVSRDDRDRGVGHALLQAASHDFPLMLCLGPTPSLQRLLSACGWHNAGSLTRIRLPLRPMRLLAGQAVGRLWRARLAERRGRTRERSGGLPPMLRAGEIARRAADALTHRGGVRRGALLTQLTATEDLEPWLRRVCRPATPAAPLRDADVYRWRFYEHPYQQYFVWNIHLGRHEEVLVAWRISEDRTCVRAILTDVLVDPRCEPRRLRRLLTLFMHELRAIGIDVAELQCSDPAIIAGMPRSALSRKSAGAALCYGRMDGRAFPRLAIDEWLISLASGALEAGMWRWQADRHAAQRMRG